MYKGTLLSNVMTDMPTAYNAPVCRTRQLFFCSDMCTLTAVYCGLVLSVSLVLELTFTQPTASVTFISFFMLQVFFSFSLEARGKD